MSYKDGVTVLFLCFGTIFTFTDCRKCDYNVLEGGSVTIIPKNIKDINVIHELKYTCGSSSVYKKRGPVIHTGDEGIIAKKYLQFKNVKKEHEGECTVESFDKQGKAILTQREFLCVYATISKPVVDKTCNNESKAVLNCTFTTAENVTFTWYQNGNKVKEGHNYTIPGKTGDKKYKCSVHNPALLSTSDEITINCVTDDSKKGSKFPSKLFGFDFPVMVGILAGGGCLVLLLVIVLITSACRSRKHLEKRLQDEEEFRLNNLQVSLNFTQQRSKQTARGQPAPPVPDCDDDYPNVDMDQAPAKTQSKPKNPTRVRPPPPPIDDDEQPPPLPQPRKKAPRTKKSEGPLPYMQP